MTDFVRIRRALLSVSDKAGIVDLARALVARGVTVLSTGGTARLLADQGVPVTPVEETTRFPEMLDGRVKTLHPNVHAAILARRDDPEHLKALREHHIEPIDLVCVNLYPFEQTVARPGCTREEAIENIDVGGPTMIRAAAKNHHHVAVLTDPAHYPLVLDELERHQGATTLALRARLAEDAFERTATYDRAIADYMRQPNPPDHAATSFPRRFAPNLELVQTLRYGENPHQTAALYRDARHIGPSIATATQLHGKELSYNNLNDAAAALALVIDLHHAASPPRTAAACIIKHANPCGAAVAHSAALAVEHAFLGDPLAAYGGILACSRPIDQAAAHIIARPNQFLEVVIAPAFDPEALETLRQRSASVRLLAVGEIPERAHRSAPPPLTARTIAGGALVQSADTLIPDSASWQHRAGPAPARDTADAAAVLWTIVKHLSSNAVAIGGYDPGAAEPRPIRLFGAGAGQMDRVTASRLATEKAAHIARGAIACSDAFFPFADGPQLLIDAGVTTLVHTGGSKRDQDTFDLCNTRDVTCLTTGVRHFRH